MIYLQKINLKTITFFVIALICSTAFVGCKMDSDKQLAYQKNVLSNGITIEYILSEYNKEKNLYVDIEKEIEIDPERSALVLIDVWEDSFLDSITIKKI